MASAHTTLTKMHPSPLQRKSLRIMGSNNDNQTDVKPNLDTFSTPPGKVTALPLLSVGLYVVIWWCR